MQKQDDLLLTRAVRAAIARNALDIAELQISCSRGVIEMSGKVKTPRGVTGNFNARKEFEVLKTQARSVRGVKDVFATRVGVVE